MGYLREEFFRRVVELHLTNNRSNTEIVDVLLMETGLDKEAVASFVSLVENAKSGVTVVGSKPNFDRSDLLLSEVLNVYSFTIGELEKRYGLIQE